MVLAKRAVTIAALVLMVALFMPTAWALLLLLGVLAWILSVFVWRRTYVSFGDDGIECIRDTRLTKSDRTIPYTRLASVGVRRSFIDTVFGTTELTFNVDSGVDSSTPEATLVLSSHEADRVRDELNRLIFVKDESIEEERSEASLVHVTNAEIVVHSFLSQSTASLIWALILLAYSVYSSVFDNSSGLAASLLLLVFSEVLPVARRIVVYSNYRLYRIGDTVTVESGLFVTSRMSFRISRISSVRVRAPLAARVIGKATLEAEVVGLQSGGDGSDATPLLCPLKPVPEVMAVMYRIVPEMVFEPDEVHQPHGAMVLMESLLCLFITACALLAFLVAWSDSFSTASVVSGAFTAALAIAVATEWTVQSHRWRSVSMGPESFLLTNGGFDRCAEYIFYDKVQKATVTTGPLQRIFGVASLDVDLLASTGFRSVSSGMFDPDGLERIPSEVMARIRDGRYDWRRYVRSKVHLEGDVRSLEGEPLLVHRDLYESELPVEVHGGRAPPVGDDDDPREPEALRVVDARLQDGAPYAPPRILGTGGELHDLPVPVVPRSDHAAGHCPAVIVQREEDLPAPGDLRFYVPELLLVLRLDGEHVLDPCLVHIDEILLVCRIVRYDLHCCRLGGSYWRGVISDFDALLIYQKSGHLPTCFYHPSFAASIT